MPSPRVLPLLVVATLCASCRQPSIGVRLRFPSEETFLVAAVASVDVYDGSGSDEKSPDAICRALSVTSAVPPSGVEALATSGKKGVCDFRDGGTTLADVGVGRRLVFVEVEDFEAAAILRGCTVVDVFGDADPDLSDDENARAKELGVDAFVDVQLATLPSFPADLEPTCADVAAKCEENAPCVP